tara:strand:+ start:1454 stop:3145 length:1692 start_codon:yes stop_codon:yes gene_type:complete
MVGTVAQAGTRVFIGGTSSGIDTAALIEAAVQQKTLRADRLDIEIDANINKIASYQKLETLAASVKTSLDRLKGSSGLFDDNETVFDLKSGTIQTSDGKDFTAIADIAIASDAVKGTYEIEVTQIAKAQRVLGTSVYTDPNADLGLAGTFELGLSGGGAPVSINITADMSLNEAVTAINAQAAGSGVRASVIKTSETDYQLVLSAQETNQPIVANYVSGDDFLVSAGVTDGAGGFNNILQAAQPAIIEFDGVTVTRNDNNFDDLAQGIDIDVKSASPGTVLTLTVGDDSTSVKDAILDFISNYNAFRDFILQNQQVSAEGVVSDNALLFGDSILSGIANLFSTMLGSNFSSTGSIRTIRDMGMTIGNGNKIEIDESKLDQAILNNFDELKAALSSSGTSDNTEFALLKNTSSITSRSIVFDITTNGSGTITDVSVGGDNSLFTINGNSIIGAAGSVYEGLTFSYQGMGSTTVNFDLNQGLADRMINSMDDYTSSIDGLIVRQKATLQTENRSKSDDAKEIRERAEAFRERQIEKYADFEARLQQLETLKNQIRAILGTDKDDD